MRDIRKPQIKSLKGDYFLRFFNEYSIMYSKE